MGSVSSSEICPNCANEAHEEFYYKTNENYFFCPFCGYTHDQYYKRDNKGKLVTKDGTDNKSFDNLILVSELVANPFGVCRIQFDKGAQMGCLKTEEDYNKFKQSLPEFIAHNEVVKVTVSRFTEGAIHEEIMFEKTIQDNLIRDEKV